MSSSENNSQLTVAQLEAQANKLWQEGNTEQAAHAFVALKNVAPDNPSLLRFIGMEAIGRKDFVVAVNVHKRLVEVTPSDPEAWLALGIALLGNRQTDLAMTALQQCLTRQPGNVAALLYCGHIAESQQQPKAALSHYLKAVRNANGPGSNPQLADFLTYARNFVGQQLDIEIEQALAPLYAEHGREALARIRQCADFFVGKAQARPTHPLWRPGLFYVPGLKPEMFFDNDDLPDLKKLEAHTDIIRTELMALLDSQDGFAPYINHTPGSRSAEIWKDLNQSADWSTYHLFRHGKKLTENCARCPQTTALVESLDLVRIPGYGPEVMFSVLAPHTRIKAHFGPVNGRVIVHLPLIVPENCGAIRVGDQQRAWKEGECLAFDDSFEHEAWNDSDARRVVLILDFWNPQLSAAERAAYTVLHTVSQTFEHQLYS